MTTPVCTPRERRQIARRRQIMDAALQIAVAEGWAAVTTRRVAEAIDYSQPVIYQHFTGRDDLIDAIAISGFEHLTAITDELAATHRAAEDGPRAQDADPRAGPDVEPVQALADLCRRYVDFGAANPRLYEAMFLRPTALTFASANTPTPLRESFVSLRRAMTGHIDRADPDEAAELLWACCHGLVSLRAAGRIPPERIEAHIARIAQMWQHPGEPPDQPGL